MGQFSWFTQDTDKQIGSERSNTITVYMYDDKGNKWKEGMYEGYGVFGGKDFYDLLAEMNGFTKDNVKGELREKGIDLYFGDDWDKKGYVSPALMESSELPSIHDFREKPKDDPNQSWPYKEWQECPECGGEGEVEYDDGESDYGWETCNACGGSGEDYYAKGGIVDAKLLEIWKKHVEKNKDEWFDDAYDIAYEYNKDKGIDEDDIGDLSHDQAHKLIEHYGISYAKGGKLSDFPKEIKLQDLLKWYTGTAYWYNTTDLTAHDNITVDGKFQSETDMDINDWLKIYRSKKVKVYIEESPNQNYDYTFELRGHKFQLWDAISIYPQVKYKLGGAIEDTNQWNTIAEIHSEVEEFVERQIDQAFNVTMENLEDLEDDHAIQDYPNIETHFFDGKYEIDLNTDSLFRDRKFQRLVEDLAKQYAKHIEIYKKDGKDD